MIYIYRRGDNYRNSLTKRRKGRVKYGVKKVEIYFFNVFVTMRERERLNV